MIKNRKLIALFFTLVLMLSLSVNVYATHIEATQTAWMGYNSQYGPVNLIGEVIWMEQDGYEFIARSRYANLVLSDGYTANLQVSLWVQPMVSSDDSQPTSDSVIGGDDEVFIFTTTCRADIAQYVRSDHYGMIVHISSGATYTNHCKNEIYPYH